MCECLEYADGAMFLCEACGPMWKEHEAREHEMQGRIETLEAALSGALAEIEARVLMPLPLTDQDLPDEWDTWKTLIAPGPDPFKEETR